MKILSDQRPFVINISIDLRPDPNGAGILRKYGKSSDGRHISRDILVPGDITLAALHFVIQNAFGFTNNHLKRFYLDNDQFLEFTKSSIKGYKKLLGVIFRLMDPEDSDQFWNDRDFFNCSNDEEYVYKWLKRKCQGPYYYNGQGELPDNMNSLYKSLASFYKKHKGEKFLDAGFDEYGRMLAFPEFEFNNLLTRLPLRTILGTQKEVENMKFFVTDYIYKYDMFPTLTRPITDRINYQYDFGDDWNFRITKRDDIEISDSDYRKVVENYSPIALKADGINLLEDVGGVYSFVDFLYSYCVEKDEDMIEWSGDWKPEVPNLETMF